MPRTKASQPRSSGSTLAGGRLAGAGLIAAVPAFAALWLFLAAIPALADGGPHVVTTNSGTSNLTADSCAGCHRAHTAQGEYLITAPSEEALCLTCHGAQSSGATTDVMTGVQYVSASAHGTLGTQLGALRSGGFDQARIDSANPARWLRTNDLGSSDIQRAKVRVAAAPADVTSAHLNLPANGLAGPGVAWGNGPIGLGDTGPGPTVSLSCGSCHNPHGNGQYRILNPLPDLEATSGSFVTALAAAVVRDSPMGTPDGTGAFPTKNYTVLQVRGTPGTFSTYMLYAQDVLDARVPGQTTWPAGDYSAAGGDYWHARVPWNTTTTNSSVWDAPNGVPQNAAGGFVAFNSQMTAWCSTCHTRYMSDSGGSPSGDALFAYRHETIDNRACTTCHVAHGSNARMEGPNSLNQPFPDGNPVIYSNIGAAPTGDSRLLKVNGRGTCQLCHDPTYTEVTNQYRGPTPTPGVP